MVTAVPQFEVLNLMKEYELSYLELAIFAVAVAALKEEVAVARAAHFVKAAGDNAVEVDRQALASGPQPVGLGIRAGMTDIARV